MTDDAYMASSALIPGNVMLQAFSLQVSSRMKSKNIYCWLGLFLLAEYFIQGIL